MKNKINLLLAVLLCLLTNRVCAQVYQPSASTSALQPSSSSVRPMSGSAYSGTVYEPFSTSAPSEQSSVGAAYSPAKAPNGPMRSPLTPGEANQSKESPIGEPWVMLLMALALGGAIAVKQYRNRITATETNNTMKPINKSLNKSLFALAALLSLGVSNVWASRTFKSGEVIYFKDTWKANGNSSTWKVDDNGNGKLCAYFYGDGDEWVNCGTIITGSWNEANALYAFTVPGDNKTYTGVIFTRGTGTDWTYTWNQTMNQTPDEGKDLFCVNNTITNDDKKDKYNGTWYTFSQYAYIEGRFHVQTAPGSNTWTNTFSTGDWNDSSTAIPMTWDATNKRFYLHTYATLKNLTDNISERGPVFYIITAHISANLTDGTGGYDASYQANTSTTFTNTNGLSGSKIQLHTYGDGRANSNLKFDYSSGTNGYVVLYFTPSDGKIWYELEYQVNFGKGTGGNTVTATAGSSLNSGDCVLSGTSVTFAHTANTGYTWAEWNTAANGSGAQRSTDQSYTVTINGSNTTNSAFTAYSKYTENTSSITVNDGTNGTVTGTGTLSLGVATKQAITATADGGYYFTGWTCTGTAAVDNPSSASTYAKTDGTNGSSGTITANFAPRYVLRGSKKNNTSATGGMPGDDADVANMDVVAATSTKTLTLEPNTEYQYKIRDLSQVPGVHGPTSSSTQGLGSGNQWTLNGDNYAYFKTKGYGSYTFNVGAGDNPTVWISDLTSHQITMGQETKTDGCGSVGTGGTVSAKTTENAVDYTISSDEYVRDGGTVTFTAAPNTGYQFIGWYAASTTNGDGSVEAVSTANPYTVSNITADYQVYALFKEILFDVTVNDGATTTTKQVGVVSQPAVTAVKKTGLVFNRWVATGSAVLNDNYANPATINSVSDNQSTITATYKEVPYIYYDITGAYNSGSGWTPSTMYVYFYNSAYWDNTRGSGYKDRPKHFGQMEKVDENGTLWRYRYDPDTIGTITNIAFMQKKQDNNEYFHENEGSYCAYHSCNNMFVVTKSGSLGKNNTQYRNDDYTGKYGYWSNYGETEEARTGLASGFYLNNLTGGGYSKEFVDENGDGVFTLTANLSGATTYGFYIGGCGGGNWSNKDLTITATGNSGIMYIYDEGVDGKYAKVTTTVPGFYTFKLSPQTGDGSEPKLTLEVEYPVAANDYRATVTPVSKKFPSNIIKGNEASGTISLWLKAGDNTISFEKASVDGSGNVSWVADGANQTVNVTKAGVYTMTLAQTGTRISDIKAYTGNYYIRTDCAPGGWQDYTDNKLTENTLTFKEDDAKTFDYYFCKWVGNAGTNVRCVIANEYNMAISDTLLGDAVLGGPSTETLPAAANVRFSYNSYTNELKRAYISGSTNPNDRFLIMKGDEKLFDANEISLDYSGTYSNLSANEAYFADRNNWVYQVDITAQSGAAVYLTAYYNGSDRDLYGSSSDKKTLITSSSSSQKYAIRTTYDFKTNNLMMAWRPNGAITEEISDIPSVMLIRKAQEQADQVRIGDGGSITGTTVYGIMQFNKYTLNNHSEAAGHATLTGDDAKSPYERSLFWVSFPFDVRLNDVFGFGEFYKHWYLEYYDGEARAKEGFWADSKGFWKFVTPEMKDTFILKAYTGYVIALDLDELGMGSSIWNNSVTDGYLYFPSKELVTIGSSLPTDVKVPAHTCTIPRDDRATKDSHWNVIGVPSYSDDETGLTQSDVPFYYRWNPETNALEAAVATTGTMKTMNAYMVQFAGTINWSTHTMTPATVAARTKSTPDKDFKLILANGTKSIDHTFVRLSNKENVTAAFEFGQDLTKEMNSGTGNIWTVTTDAIPVAGNSLPMGATVVPVGVQIAAEGEYTFSMPEGTNGTGAVLIDNIAGTRTNLALTDYTVQLPAGQTDNRFVLELSPISNVTTEIENVQGTKARKKIVDGVLYIVKDGQVFDARGQRIH